MEASAACLNLIRVSEGLSLNPYRDPAGYWTVGFGHKLGPDDAAMPVTYQEAESLLVADVGEAERGVTKLTTGLNLSQGQFDALVDFAYECGEPALATSTLLRLLRAGEIYAAANEFAKWVHAGGKVQNGMVKRRKADRDLFLAGMPLDALT